MQFGVWGNINRIVNRSPEHQAQHPGPAKREVIGGMDTVSNDMAKLNKISNAMIFLTFLSRLFARSLTWQKLVLGKTDQISPSHANHPADSKIKTLLRRLDKKGKVESLPSILN